MIDTHCHINDDIYSSNSSSYIEEAMISGVKTFFVIGFDIESSKKAVEIAQNNDNCYAAIGIHPSDWKKAPNDAIEQLEKLITSKKVIAVGEIGLDFYWDKDERIKKEQADGFVKQIELANKYNLPVIIHCREASEGCLNILKEHHLNKGGIMHCYASSYEMSKEFIKQGLLLGVGGVVTFKNAVTLKEVVSKIPSDSYVLETDAPYLAPDPYRGKPNHSKYLYLIRNKIAELRGETPEKVESDTTANALRMFNL